MKIRTKVLLVAITSLILGTVGCSLVVATIMSHYLEKEEVKGVENNFKNASLILNSDIKVLEAIELDWTHWDDTYAYLEGKEQTYEEENLGKTTLSQLNLCGMVFINRSLDVIHYDFLSKEDTTDLSTDILSKDTLKILVKDVTSDHLNSGISSINGEMFLISACGVTSTDGLAESNGYFITIRKLDAAYLNYIGNLLNGSISFHDTENVGATTPYEQFELSNITRTSKILKSNANIKDIITDKSIRLEVECKRTSYLDAVSTYVTSCILIVIIFFIIMLACLWSIHTVILKKIFQINIFVDKVVKNEDVTLIMDVNGKDEISDLTININNMLEKLNSNFNKIKKNDERLHLIIEATSDGYFDFDKTTEIITISFSWLKHIGFDVDENKLAYNLVLSYMIESDREKFNTAVRDYVDGKEQQLFVEVRVNKDYGEYIWVLIRGKIVDFDKHGLPIRWIGSISDITLRKNAEQEKISILQTDPVTQLKNRSYMETILNELEESKNQEYFLLMADVNGLKLTNDTFGHQEGDRLLYEVATVFRNCCSSSDIPARWGGDEFLILTKNNRDYMNKLEQKIQLELSKVSSFPIKVSVAMGFSTFHPKDVSIEQTISRAEKKMYRNKLFESKQVRKEIISSLEQTLNEKQLETTAHKERIKHLCLEVAAKLRLSPEDREELALLSALHDIGKVAIPDSILRKTDPLTTEELKIMQSHTEAGYRIVRTIPELSPIANKILAHHEYYDGTGYPSGIAKEEIPLISRILCTVHAYDGMIHGTTRKKLISKEDAMKELRTYSGTKFDPLIVEILIELLLTKEPPTLLN